MYFFGEYLANSQGEDVVVGIKTPKTIPEIAKELPESYKQLLAIKQKLEQHYHEVQDLEFIIERNKLYILQTRNVKMNNTSTVRTTVEMVEEGLINKE